MDKYHQRQFKNKEQSIRIPDEPKMEKYIEKLETIVKRWGWKKSFFKYQSGLFPSGFPLPSVREGFKAHCFAMFLLWRAFVLTLHSSSWD